MTNLLIKNTTVVTLSNKNEIFKNHSIAIKDGFIEKIMPTNDFNNQDFDQIIDGQNKICMPGFINAHSHFYSAFARGLYKIKPSNNFLQILENLWWRLDKKLTLEDCYYSALLSSITAIKHGCTTVVDHHSSPSFVLSSLITVAKAAQKTGLRTCLSYELSNRNGDKCAQESVQENTDFIASIDKKNHMLKAMFGLHASFTIDDKTLNLAAKTNKSGFHIHVAESKSDQELTQKLFGDSVVSRLEKFSILGPKTICAHCVHVSDEEIALLAKSGSMVVHNHQSNLNNAVGIAPMSKLMSAGVLVGLGTDAITYNMLMELKSAILAQNLACNNPNTGFKLCCPALLQNNQKIASRIFEQSIGQIAPNFTADLILLDYQPYTEFSSNSLWGHIAFGLSEAQVDTTIVNGKVLMQNKKLLSLDENDIYQKALNLATSLFKRF